MNLSSQIFARATDVLPGGNTRTTIFHPPHPPYGVRGAGPRIWDVDGVERLDVNNNYTSLIHGHCHPVIVEAVQAQAARLMAASVPTEAEVQLAETLCSRSRAFERIRFTNSGSEAVMMAIKAARAFTGRPMVAKAEGAYHGSYDVVEVSLDSDPSCWGTERAERLPYCRGTPDGVLDNAVIYAFNDIDATLAALRPYQDQLAAVIIDPVPTRIGLIGVTTEFLQALRTFCSQAGCLLICDEVISYRTAFGGAHQLHGVQPDLVTLGKIIGGGLPVGAVAGSARVMSVFDGSRGKPPVPHGGTFNANPMTMVAGQAALDLFDNHAVERLNGLGEACQRELRAVIARHGQDGDVRREGSLLRIRLASSSAKTYRDDYPSDGQRRSEERLFRALLESGLLIGRNLVLALSTVMTEEDVAVISDRFSRALKIAASDPH